MRVATLKKLTLLTVLAMSACSAPNHLGNPLTLPVRGLAAAVENAAYDRRRGVVKSWIIENEAALRAEGFDGPVTDELLGMLPKSRWFQARRDLVAAAEYEDFAERATVIIMVLST